MSGEEFNKKVKEFLPVCQIVAYPDHIKYYFRTFDKNLCEISVERINIEKNWEDALFELAEAYFRGYYSLIKECISYEKDMFSQENKQ